MGYAEHLGAFVLHSAVFCLATELYPSGREFPGPGSDSWSVCPTASVKPNGYHLHLVTACSPLGAGKRRSKATLTVLFSHDKKRRLTQSFLRRPHLPLPLHPNLGIYLLNPHAQRLPPMAHLRPAHGPTTMVRPQPQLCRAPPTSPRILHPAPRHVHAQRRA